MVKKLEQTAGVHPEFLREICDHYEIEAIWELPISEYYAALGYIEWKYELLPAYKRGPLRSYKEHA